MIHSNSRALSAGALLTCLCAFGALSLPLSGAPAETGRAPADASAPQWAWRLDKHGVRRTPVVEATEKAMPSVVNISTERVMTKSFSPWNVGSSGDPFDGMLEDFVKRQGNQVSYSLGSGSIIDSSGLVVTNAHVVHRASKITVTLNDGRSFEAREMAGDYLNDLSLLQIINPPADLKAIETAAPGDLLLGETVVAVGNPFGLDSSITHGVLSATGRKLTFEGKVVFSDIIQTDAAVYPGNSGGPLINIEGRMIGINMAFHKDAPGIGFAIPLARVENALAKWLIPERFSNICLGIVPAVRPSKSGAPEIYLADVIKESSAEKAGLKPGDVLVSFQGAPLRDLLAFGKSLIRLKEGQEASLGLAGGREVKLKMFCMMLKDGKTAARNRLGLGLQELTPQLASALGYPFDGGLIVSDLLAGLPPGVERGDMLARLGESPVHSWDDVARALEGRPYGDKLEAVFVSISIRNGVGYLTKKLIDLTVK